MGTFEGLSKIESQLRSMGNFFIDPRLTVLEVAEDGRVEWMGSVTWPLPWLPRVIVKGSSEVRVEGNKVGSHTGQRGLMRLVYVIGLLKSTCMVVYAVCHGNENGLV
ncbi:unnamed protein product [Discosporangium mesarthrocarpum]